MTSWAAVRWSGWNCLWKPLCCRFGAKTPRVAEDQPASALHILVVDDIAMNRDIAGSFLRLAGHAVTCVEGGEEAVAALTVADFDVVLMDVRMPVMDGLEATRRIRSLAGGRGRVPIVALTVQSDAEQVAECRKAGMDYDLAKPFDPDALHAVVVRAFEARHAHGERVGHAVVPLVAPGPLLAPGPAVAPAAGRLCVIGTEMAVFDLRVFERAAISLAPEMVASSLRTITEQAHELLCGPHAPGALDRTKEALAEAALTLAGSAGILGFKRLTAVGRRFERAVRSGAAEVHVLAFALSAALEATLKEISDRMSVAVGRSGPCPCGPACGVTGWPAGSHGQSGRRERVLDGTAAEQCRRGAGVRTDWRGGGGGRAGGAHVPAVRIVPTVRVLNVLVVDDIMMNRDIAGSFLRSARPYGHLRRGRGGGGGSGGGGGL